MALTLSMCMPKYTVGLLLSLSGANSPRLGEDKTIFNLDLQVQLLLKQGQVEIDEGDFIPDYSGSVLVHRRDIENLNKEIKVCHL